MRVEILKQYINLVEFLGLVLGPSYEIALYDLNRGDDTIVAIANGQVTGRSIGSPLTSPILVFLSNERYKTLNHEVNYTVFNMTQKKLRSSTLYIKDNGELAGLLCITFYDQRYKDISKLIMGLCHPDELLQENNFEKIEDLKTDNDTSIYGRDIQEVFNNSLQSILKVSNVPIDRLKKEEKLKIVASLKDKGIFLLNGSVTEVAKLLDSSEATIYRYINEVEQMETKE
ncbi:helix-turn-helix transcriptional regulator [Schinkia azotoformans]|uniref:helix-turn-helix transcriptional regulator n=1 Tax=Schinkia azotoformans TaxID=1454 RepID=UPI0030C97499